MILYFTGTGNSEYVAKRISKIINDETLNLFDKIRNKDYSEIATIKPFIIVAPTYAWRIPHIVNEWLEKTSLSGNNNIYFIMTCGGEIRNAGKYLKELCVLKNANYMGCNSILMPENYIALFKTPEKVEAIKIINQAESFIDRTADYINNGEKLPEPKIKILDKLMSGVVNDLFYPIYVKSNKFYATNACISCGKCARSCPLNNIRIENNKPSWGDNCTHCMACICRCPSESIEYGKHSVDLPRYICPKKL